MALWNTLGDLLEGSGWTTALTEADVASSGMAASFLKAAHLTRTRHAHQVTVLTLHNLQQEAFRLSAGPKDEESLLAWRNDMLKKSPTFMVWDLILKYETLILIFIRAHRERNFLLYIEVLEALVPLFFALDHSLLNLPHRDGGSRKFRFLYLTNSTSFRLTECPNTSPSIPLFLGADLFSNTDIRTENHPRYHAKFAKKGLATKLKFSTEFRFHGLKVPTVSNSLWFYSVQGLFRVAFEMYNRQEQLAVLENFQDVWKSQMNDSPLKMNYNLNMQLDSSTSKSITEANDKDLRNKLVSHTYSCPDVQEFVIPCQTDPGFSGNTSVDHDYCSFSEESMQTEAIQIVSSTLRQKLHALEKKLSSVSQSGISQLETTLLLLENIDQYMNGTLEERDVTGIVLALLEAKSWGSVYSSHLLNSVGRWLGQQFHEANSSISQQVERFKVQHIEHITDLPPAEELVRELFPEAMQMLLLHWMGLSEESTLEKRHSEYPILLLILEFANHNLITGVAHVLYSSLLCR
ncbi:uncharacterized protein si:ch211-110p13.9 [Lampris incognitus]|uniref:uncharacterized protein si:ch211-110p13.9 n=1 Tax=Lampris incognitus TaxID=2546036 RepID=UPI0024B5A021|nr:uncharacterized protein si:ch211-110p13.9 [Lampris incognitus]